jgi:endonuclease G
MLMLHKLFASLVLLSGLLPIGGCDRQVAHAPRSHVPIAAAPTAGAAPESCADHYLDGRAPRILNAKLAPATRELCFNVFTVMHSGVTRTPLWSAEHLEAQEVESARQLSRENSFHAETRLPAGQRAELADYARSGFHRRRQGHRDPDPGTRTHHRHRLAARPQRGRKREAAAAAERAPEEER